MNIYNSLTRKVEKFTPNEDNIVRMYTCGPTVYHYAHIGNLRTYIFEDILEKGLEYLGYTVLRVMNVTDVGHLENDSDDGEDKMQKSAAREKKSAYEIADFYERAFFSDCSKLNIRKPSVVERATKHIDTYIEMIESLLDKGFAYKSNGNIYFDITKANNYYQLSGKNAEELYVGVRDTVEEDTSKRNPGDFGLWFTVSKFANQEMKWDSPWGVGYPGWHIECSGISYKYLGEYLDIHCGGVDNIFPHHTNEIAQSEAFLGHKWCNYWIHGEHLNDANGKMSKSKGEFLTISLLEEKKYNPLAYRYFCLNSHYRNQLVFSFDALEGAQNAYNKLKQRIKALDRTPDLHDDKIDYYQNKFKEAIENDLNTSSMVTLVYDVLKDEELTDFTKLYLIEDFDKVLSLGLIEEEKTIDEETELMILAKIEERNIAKKNKDYEKADKIRAELFDKGVRIIDGRDKTTYEIM
ncbi:MAG: cysteine--tRNA ligase [Clostridiales bacterium]|nr:cysteine--tRNA ligase [Clostridiales bacterium]